MSSHGTKQPECNLGTLIKKDSAKFFIFQFTMLHMYYTEIKEKKWKNVTH